MRKLYGERTPCQSKNAERTKPAHSGSLINDILVVHSEALSKSLPVNCGYLQGTYSQAEAWCSVVSGRPCTRWSLASEHVHSLGAGRGRNSQSRARVNCFPYVQSPDPPRHNHRPISHAGCRYRNDMDIQEGIHCGTVHQRTSMWCTFLHIQTNSAENQNTK